MLNLTTKMLKWSHGWIWNMKFPFYNRTFNCVCEYIRLLNILYLFQISTKYFSSDSFIINLFFFKFSTKNIFYVNALFNNISIALDFVLLCACHKVDKVVVVIFTILIIWIFFRLIRFRFSIIGSSKNFQRFHWLQINGIVENWNFIV